MRYAPAPYARPYVCEVCGEDADEECECPPCPDCGTVGNPDCYEFASDGTLEVNAHTNPVGE